MRNEGEMKMKKKINTKHFRSKNLSLPARQSAYTRVCLERRGSRNNDEIIHLSIAWQYWIIKIKLKTFATVIMLVELHTLHRQGRSTLFSDFFSSSDKFQLYNSNSFAGACLCKALFFVNMKRDWSRVDREREKQTSKLQLWKKLQFVLIFMSFFSVWENWKIYFYCTFVLVSSRSSPWHQQQHSFIFRWTSSSTSTKSRKAFIAHNFI